MRETEIQRAVLQHLATRGTRNVFFFHVPNGGVRSPIEAKILKGQGVVAGVPDILAIKDGAVFGLELKAPRWPPFASPAGLPRGPAGCWRYGGGCDGAG
jgi:hypothetical protein